MKKKVRNKVVQIQRILKRGKTNGRETPRNMFNISICSGRIAKFNKTNDRRH